MTTQASRILILFIALITLVTGQSCKVAVPFSTNLVGRSFYIYDDCYRPRASSSVAVHSKLFVYKPMHASRSATFTCEEKFVFHFRRDGKDPFVTRFPPLEVHDGDAFANTDELDNFCKQEQPKLTEKFFPVGNTRQTFIKAVREIVKGALEIRDFGCTETQDGLIVQTPGRAFTNVDLDAVITYLLGVAYEYNFCAEAA